jgi:hypothetical protein
MKLIRYALLTFILLLVSSACTAITTEYFHLHKSGGDFCLAIATRNFWEAGNGGDELHNHLLSEFDITLDGRDVEDDFTLWITPLIGYFILDEEGQIIGTYGASIQGCLEAWRPSALMHRLEVRTSTLSGIEKSQTWLIIFGEFVPLRFYFDEPAIEHFYNP